MYDSTFYLNKNSYCKYLYYFNLHYFLATFGLNEDQVAIQQLATDFAKNELQPYMSKWDQEQIFPVETLKKAAALGFGAVYTRPDYGGTGLSRLEASVVFEALSQGCVSTTAYITIHKYGLIAVTIV